MFWWFLIEGSLEEIRTDSTGNDWWRREKSERMNEQKRVLFEDMVALVWLCTHTPTHTHLNQVLRQKSVNRLKTQTCCYSERKRGPVTLLWGGASAVTDVSFTRRADRKDTSPHAGSDLLLWKHGSISVKTLDVPKHEKWKLCKRLHHCCPLDNTSI